MSYAPLHLHSHFSMLDGHGTPMKYMKRAAELGLPAAAITDHGNVSGILDFYEAGQEHGVKPILGLEAYQARKTRFDQDEEERTGRATKEFEQRGPYHLTILSKNEEGYKNLIKLSSRSWLEGYYQKPRIDHDLLSQHADGLIVLSGCLSGEVQRALLRDDFDYALSAAAKMQDIVGKDNYYIEIQDHNIDDQRRVRDDTIQIARKINALIVPTGDCHYVRQEDATNHDLMLCVQTNSQFDEENRFRFAGSEFYLKSHEEMLQIFPSEWLDTTTRIAESVELDLRFDDHYFPNFPIPDNHTYNSYLEESVWNGLLIRYGDPLPKDVTERAKYELKIIKEMGFQSYFMVVCDLVRWAREHEIRTGVGRGSAASSIISYALGITNLDPIRYKLLFERFLVPGRKSLPDIDLDFDDRYRDQVIEYARQKYGSDHIANICTFTTIGSRSAVRDATRVLGYDFLTGDKIAKLVPPPIQGFAPSLEESLTNPDLKKLYDNDEVAHKILEAAKGIEGIVRQTGIHAAGIVIAQSAVTDFVPVMRKGIDAPVVTQWDMNWVERNGQLKIDFLGLRNLAILDICCKLVYQRYKRLILLDKIPLNDQSTYDMLCAGHSIGVFQMEGGGIKKMMMALRPDCIEDLMAVVALYRPGPLGSHMDRTYIARKHGREAIRYDHPLLEDVLGDTYGVMLYQEQVLLAAQRLAGFTIGESDDLRKAIGKKMKDKIAILRKKFVEGCVANGIQDHLANKIYSDIEFFGSYGFNTAHSASYAITSYWTAYLKTHYPVEYMTAVLTTVDDTNKLGIYINECRRMGISVYAPSINKSVREFTVLSETEILFGLRAIKGLGPSVCDALIDCRKDPYQNIYDFVRRVDASVLNKAVLEALIYSGTLDELLVDQPQKLFSRTQKMELLTEEKKRLGAYVTENPVTGVWTSLGGNISHEIVDLDDEVAGTAIKIAGIINRCDKKTTKRGDSMYILNVEDLTAAIEVISFPRETKRFENKFEEGKIVYIEGRLQKEGDEDNSFSKVILTDIQIPELSEFQSGVPITLQFPQAPPIDILNALEELIELYPGDSPVFIEFPQHRHILSLRFKKPTSLSIEEDLRLLTLKERLSI